MKTKVTFLILAVLLTLCSVIYLGCNSAPGTNGPFPFGTFTIAGVFVSDPNVDTVQAVVHLKKGSNLFTSAEVSLDNTLLTPKLATAADSVFYYTARHYLTFATGPHYVIVDDTVNFRDSALISIADSFVILTVSPFNHQIAGNPRQANLTWSVSNNGTGFIMAAVKTNNTYTGNGWSGYVQTFGNAGTIPPEAFLKPDGINPDTGLYNIYVYSYWGVPDSALSHTILPVPLPSQLPDNINQSDFKGHFGTVMVTFLDTVRVTQQ